MTVARRHAVSTATVVREHLRASVPVVVSDELERWPALRRWSFSFLRERHGALRVTAEIGLGGAEREAFPMTLAGFIERLLDPAERQLYLRHWEFWRDAPELAADQRPPGYLRDWFGALPQAVWPRMNWVFMGPTGSRTHLHVDSLGTHSWLAQIAGRKRWLLFPPEQLPCLYPRPRRRGGLGELFEVDPDHPDGVDLARFPRYAEARPLVVETGPGDLMVIPARWPHSVVNLEPTLALTGNFMGPGADFATCLREGLGYRVDELRERVSGLGRRAGG